MGVVTLSTDFGTRDPYVGAMKGAILAVNPDVILTDLSHDLPPQDVRAGSYLLRHATSCFPPGTIHLAVVDPGVGSTRRGLVVDDGQHLWVGPDNGLFSHVLARPSARTFELTNPALRRDVVSATFHGRDMFAPAAAHFSMGVDPSEAGPSINDPVRLPDISCQQASGGLMGHIQHIDHFGNLVTSIGLQDLAGMESATIVVGQTRLAGWSTTYADVGPGQPLALIGSGGMLEISIRDGNAARQLDLTRGTEVLVQTFCENSE